ncbi:hypothetical protein JH06_4399 [Blastocystis sp. subtype 4]|uniref:hypothetical protein n=1 Tax=Blastocystis sp. subtype 4 TaxID=944170 RepID=UPI0007113C66|nr:hypothetical protein JH06_4399 [Blastocystis sp. subtype 4]KNB42618.1 hypothetical protein JH06_4399 [Blastocystis sp. subtype 4]|eukprot:XP_014526061.1 hypothetical protein JH06_4399 [Blastocystis sp. subtype 4]
MTEIHEKTYLKEYTELQSTTLHQQRMAKQHELDTMSSSQSNLIQSIQTLQETLRNLQTQSSQVLGNLDMPSLSNKIYAEKSTLSSLRSTFTHTTSIPFDDTLGLLIEQFTFLPQAQSFRLCFYQLLKPYLSVILCSTYIQSQVLHSFHFVNRNLSTLNTIPYESGY